MRRIIFIIILFISLTIFFVTLGTAAKLEVFGGVLQVFRMDVDIEIPLIPAEVDIKPESLCKNSAGQSVTAFIELTPGYNVADIDITTVRLCLGTAPGGGGIAPNVANPMIVGHGLKITFGRTEVLSLVEDVHPPATVTFTIYGNVGGYIFAGSDTVRLVGPEGS